MKWMILPLVLLLTTCAPGKPPELTKYEVIGDINGDHKMDCIDAALVFYEMCIDYGIHARLIYGENNEVPFTSHLWVRVEGIDVEPFAYLRDSYPNRQEDVTRNYRLIKNNIFDWKRVHVK